jgi:hypothetical protein
MPLIPLLLISQYGIVPEKEESTTMASSQAVQIEEQLIEKVGALNLQQRREVLDFVEFITSRRRSFKPRRGATTRDLSDSKDGGATCPLDGIVGIAAECGDTDLSINHDKYLYSEHAP